MNTYFVKYQLLDAQQLYFEFVGVPFEFAIVKAETAPRAELALHLQMAEKHDPNRFAIRINTTIECYDTVTIVPIKIEENTIVNNKRKPTYQDIKDMIVEGGFQDRFSQV